MTVDVAELLTETLLQLADNRVRLEAMRTLVITILDEHHRGIHRSLNVIALRDRRR
jgi:hypothetical protein